MTTLCLIHGWASNAHIFDRLRRRLPESWISTFSLDAGAARPAFSVYFNVSAEGELSAPETKIERVFIETNLRIQDIEPHFNSETGIGNAAEPQFPHHADLIYLLNLAHALQKRRDRYHLGAIARSTSR